MRTKPHDALRATGIPDEKIGDYFHTKRERGRRSLLPRYLLGSGSGISVQLRLHISLRLDRVPREVSACPYKKARIRIGSKNITVTVSLFVFATLSFLKYLESHIGMLI